MQERPVLAQRDPFSPHRRLKSSDLQVFLMKFPVVVCRAVLPGCAFCIIPQIPVAEVSSLLLPRPPEGIFVPESSCHISVVFIERTCP